MDADAMLVAARNLAILAVILLLAQWWLVRVRGRQVRRQQVNARLTSKPVDVSFAERDAKLAGGRFERLQLKAGLNLGQSTITLLLIAIVAIAILALVLAGFWLALLVPIVAIVLAVVYWNIRYQRRRRMVFENLPSAIDDVIRGIDAGRSLELALVDSFNDAPVVFEPLAFRLRSAVEAGRDYTRLMDDFARLYRVPPLVFVAVALRTSSRFGSSIRPILKKVSKTLRSQQEMRREFMAATAETRFTAVAFAVLPVGIGAAMIAMNESFRSILLGTDAGHKMLAVSFALIVTGTLIIFRMVQGVGRG